MFKNVNIYRINLGSNTELDAMEAALDAVRFTPCSPNQDHSCGFVEPRGQANGPLVESVAGQRILKFMIETKSVPGAATKKKAQEAADHIEATTARTPGKKEMKQLREDAYQALLPTAFPRQSAVMVWIDVERGLLVTDAATKTKNDDLMTVLVNALPGFTAALLNTKMTPQTAMTQWLLAESPGDWPEGLAIERECVLRSDTEDKALVRFSRHHLLNDEVRKHIAEGKLPASLALSWEGRIGFLMTDSFKLKKLIFLEGVIADKAAEGEDPFDSDVALSTGELRQMIPALITALGGELQSVEKSDTDS